MWKNLKKYEIVKKNTDFNDIINTGRCIRNKYYSIYYKDSEDDFPKFGLAVSKKCGNAVDRNKIKRQLRNLNADNKKLFSIKMNYIIMVRKEILNVSYLQMEEQLINLIKKG